MAVEWMCDFPSCQAASREHKGWERWNNMTAPSWWLLTIIPLVGFALHLIDLEDAKFYCPEHVAFLRNDNDEAGNQPKKAG